ncbi:hypothetical protein NHX12_024856 [Muraenolepis orangiensis]|uniref:Uncharacterized protein n=1 Tax=Muraenolepis orangiensis TaxID=630683 RepID=A0A9Q0ELU2_9TELE|nr:hypothetical protein NHX12_024856 [Muraenolepis orangiensis]
MRILHTTCRLRDQQPQDCRRWCLAGRGTDVSVSLRVLRWKQRRRNHHLQEPPTAPSSPRRSNGVRRVLRAVDPSKGVDKEGCRPVFRGLHEDKGPSCSTAPPKLLDWGPHLSPSAPAPPKGWCCPPPLTIITNSLGAIPKQNQLIMDFWRNGEDPDRLHINCVERVPDFPGFRFLGKRIAAGSLLDSNTTAVQLRR